MSAKRFASPMGRIVDNVIASQRLEGLEPDPQAIADLRRVANGELHVDDVIRSFRARLGSSSVRSSRVK